jgi:hypothetical protein
MNTANENDVAKVIRAMDEEFMRLIAARDFKQLTTNFYAEDAQFLPPNHAAIIGRPAIQEALGQIAAGLQKLTYRSALVTSIKGACWETRGLETATDIIERVFGEYLGEKASVTSDIAGYRA